MNIYSIYRSTNIITGKIYIGFTSKTVKHRAERHRISALVYDSQTKFHKSIREFGFENFVFECIYQSKEKCDILESHTFNFMEDFFIQEYDSIEKGYNTRNGGASFPVLRGENHPLFEVGHTELTKKKISENHFDVSGSNNPNAKKIIIILPNKEKIIAHGNLDKVCEKNGFTSDKIYQMLSSQRNVLVRGKLKGLQAYYFDDYSVTDEVQIKNKIEKDKNARSMFLNKKHFCEHCGKEANLGNLKRWHGDNCPSKQ